jgi:hypothetical protein
VLIARNELSLRERAHYRIVSLSSDLATLCVISVNALYRMEHGDSMRHSLCPTDIASLTIIVVTTSGHPINWSLAFNTKYREVHTPLMPSLPLKEWIAVVLQLTVIL